MQKFYLQKEDNSVYTSLYEVEKSETVRKRLNEVKMEMFGEFVERIKNKEYEIALINFSKEIFTYVQPTDKK